MHFKMFAFITGGLNARS